MLDEDYRVSLTGLDKNEVLSLFISGKTAPLQDLGLENTFEDALLKLFTALPSIHRREVEWMQQRVHVDPTRWFQISEPLPFFELVQQAAWENRVIQASFKDSDGALTDQTLEAYGLVAKNNIWYLVGRNPAGEFRSFRIFRFQACALTERFFERQPDFDLPAYWKESCQNYEKRVAKDNPPVQCLVRVHPSIMWYFDSTMSGKFEQIGQADFSGCATLQVQFDSLADAAVILPGFGSQVEVIEPAELRHRVRQTALAILQLYAAPNSQIDKI